MKKRGQFTLKFSSELLISAIVVLTFFAISYTYGTGEAIAKLRIAKDVGLIIEEMYLIPNEINAFITYPENASKFRIDIKENLVTVSSTVNDVTKGSYHFVNSLNHPILDITLKEPKELYIGKINGVILVSDKKPDLRTLKCPKIKQKSKIENILIDSGVDENNNIEKAKLANSIAFSLISRLSEDYTVEHARNSDIIGLITNPLSLVQSTIAQKISQSDAVIRIQIGEKRDNSNNIKIYFSPDSSKKEEIQTLGCNILNNLIGNEDFNGITGIAVIPTDTESILDNNKISMIIEIGNYADRNSLNMLKNVDVIETISSTIYNILKNEETK